MEQTRTRLERLAPLAVRLAALWVLGVSSIKLFKGSPNDLPPIVRDHFFGPEVNFNLSIGVELSSAFVALLYPLWGWIALSALMSLFVGVLLYLISIGATSCGCFGGAIHFPPAAMLAVDGSLLAFMLLARPWNSIEPSRPPRWTALAAVAVAFAAPWLLIRTTKVEIKPPAIDGSAAAPWQLPARPWPRYVDLPVAKWIGKPLRVTDIAPWIDVASLPTEDNRWIIYRRSCEHCRDYLRQAYNEQPVDPDLVLIEMVDDLPPQVDLLPDTPWKAQLPKDIEWVIAPPWLLRIRSGVIQEAKFQGGG